MKKIIYISLILMAFFSCQKKDETPQFQDVSFTAIDLTPDVGLKSTDSTIVCKTDIPDYAAVKIEGQWYFPALFNLDNKLYTQAIKLTPGNYDVEEFFLYKNIGGTAGYEAGDIIVFATPTSTSQFAQYVTTPLEYSITVTAFAKAQVDMQVICFQDHQYTSFGFNWFAVTEIVVREQCFFGDICLDGNPFTSADFNGSFYGNNLGVDLPAIMKIEVYRDNQPLPAPYFSFNNEAWKGIGAPLCVTYPDNLSVTGEVFTFKLYILVKNTTGGLSYQLYQTLTATDAGVLNIATGSDGVLDFVLGTCNYSATDLPLTWLPALETFTPPTIDGVIGNTEWYGAASIILGYEPAGTAYFFTDQNYLYVAFKITKWLPGEEHMLANLVAIQVGKGEGNSWPAGDWITFLQSTTAAYWGNDGETGILPDGWQVGAWRLNNVNQASFPADLSTVTSWAAGYRVTEIKIPLSFFGDLLSCDVLHVFGGTFYDGNQHIYFPKEINGGWSDHNYYGHITVTHKLN